MGLIIRILHSAMVIVTMKNIVMFILFIITLLMLRTIMKDIEMGDLTRKLFDEKTPDEVVPAVYRERGDHVGDLCRKHKAEIARRYKKFWPRENYSTVMGKADIFYNKKAGFLWCRVPKAASESWSGVFINKWYAFIVNIFNQHIWNVYFAWQIKTGQVFHR